MILQLLLDHFGSSRQIRVLDAGCGKGWLSGKLAEMGFLTTGVDISEAAIEFAKNRGLGSFYVSCLDQFSSPDVYDAVICMDVLFHILDDTLWENTILNLGSLLGNNGLFILSDDLRDRTYHLGDYIVHRSRVQYTGVLNLLSLKIRAEIPYRVFGNPNSLIACTRG